MYMAMMDAAVGDDVYGEDPTVTGLERTAAGLLDKEAAVFVPTATMANLLAVGAHCARGEGVVLGDESHIFYYEQGGASGHMGAVFHALPNRADGTMALAGGRGSVRHALESRAAWHGDVHLSRIGCVAIENTHNRMGGRILSPEYVDDLAALCAEFSGGAAGAAAGGVKLHCDGARLMNAAAASGHSAARLARGVESVSICLSKGLGAPLGALLVGGAETVRRARRLRKAVGGGMRQAGVIAACGLVGLKEHAPLLAADHLRTRAVWRGLAGVRGVVVEAAAPETNIIWFDLDPAVLDARRLDAAAERELRAAVPRFATGGPLTTAAAFAALVERSHRCKVATYGDARLRAVLHHQVTDGDVERLIDGARAAAKALSAP
jgi:threonine aldolase